MTTKHQQKETEVDKFPFEEFAHPIQISDHEFVISTDALTMKLMKFNAKTQSWTELFDYSNLEEARRYDNINFSEWSFFEYHSLAHDSTTNKFYVVSTHNTILEIDINSKQMTLYKNPFGDTSIHPGAIVVNNQLHIICGYESNRHIIFDTITKKWSKHHTFNELERGLSSGALIHVTTKQAIYLLGGFDSGENGGHTDTVRRYSLHDKAWKDLLLRLPVKSKCPCFLSTDERYIVVMYSCWDEAKEVHYGKIYYMDLEREPLEFVESALRPSFKIEHTIMTGNNKKARLMVYGYIRSLTLANMMIPDELMKLIIAFCDEEFVHFFEMVSVWNDDEDNETGYHKHFIVPLSAVIQSW